MLLGVVLFRYLQKAHLFNYLYTGQTNALEKALRNELAYFLLLEPFLATRRMTSIARATRSNSISKCY
jgi:hypothetical protein